MKKVIKIGKPTHYRPNNKNVTACGVISPEYFAYDARDVDCLRCMKTKKYKSLLDEIGLTK